LRLSSGEDWYISKKFPKEKFELKIRHDYNGKFNGFYIILNEDK